MLVSFSLLLCCNIVFGITSNSSLSHELFSEAKPSRLWDEIAELVHNSDELSSSESQISPHMIAPPPPNIKTDRSAQMKRYSHHYPKIDDSIRSPSHKGDQHGEFSHHGGYQSGWSGWAAPQKQEHHHHHHHSHKGEYGVSKKGSKFSDLALFGLSALAFGTFLTNLLMNLYSLGSGYYTTTGPITTTGTATGWGNSNGNGGGSTSTSTTSTGGTGTGGGITFLSDGGYLSGMDALYGLALHGRGRVRKRRAAFQPNVDTFTSFEVMSNFILNSIETIKHKPRCLPSVLCTGCKRAKVIGKGYQYFIPFFSVCALIMGERLGVREVIPEHFRAIYAGLSESNCQSDFPEC